MPPCRWSLLIISMFFGVAVCTKISLPRLKTWECQRTQLRQLRTRKALLLGSPPRLGGLPVARTYIPKSIWGCGGHKTNKLAWWGQTMPNMSAETHTQIHFFHFVLPPSSFPAMGFFPRFFRGPTLVGPNIGRSWGLLGPRAHAAPDARLTLKGPRGCPRASASAPRQPRSPRRRPRSCGAGL